MSRAVHKFPLQPGQCTSFVPAGGVVRHVDQQLDCPTVWIEVEPTAPSETWTFETFGTGHTGITDRHEYLGTAVCMGGMLVWHVYRLRGTA